MCIYFGDAPNLTYNKSEHIFPAGLGGTVTLPQGWVSDQANELFSSMEGELMHDSLLALDRYFFGPGDDGARTQSQTSLWACRMTAKSRCHTCRWESRT